jgi:uncharacterized membrane protein
MNKDLLIILTAGLPLSELRVAIPLGLAMDQPILKTFLLAIFGNSIPVIPLLFLFKPISKILRTSTISKNFFDWYLKRAKKRADIIEKYESLGLAIFVAIPLPFTGAWTGAIAASLFGLRFRYALIAIICGIIFAGTIVTILSILGIITLKAIG